jgi:hypothetical protein
VVVVPVVVVDVVVVVEVSVGVAVDVVPVATVVATVPVGDVVVVVIAPTANPEPTNKPSANAVVPPTKCQRIRRARIPSAGPRGAK